MIADGEAVLAEGGVAPGNVHAYVLMVPPLAPIVALGVTVSGTQFPEMGAIATVGLSLMVKEYVFVLSPQLLGAVTFWVTV